MRRRKFLAQTAMVSASGMLLPNLGFSLPRVENEILYNGIRLPKVWPPTYMDPAEYDPMPVPYLSARPSVVPIDVGRQLLVDNFLIEKTDLKRIFHKARKVDTNPIFYPETELEQGYYGITTAAPKDGGVWWDPKDKLFKMWYETGWLQGSAYAESKDGIHWERPDLDIQPGTNRILPYLLSDSTTVFIDHETKDPKERFKMFFRPPTTSGMRKGYCMVSGDGIHWSLPVETGFCGDRSTIFYNPFRKKWVYSIRSTREIGNTPHGRSRYYWEHSDFLKGAKWKVEDLVYWTGADRLDMPDSEIGDKPQLYNLSAVGYESLMLGFHQIHLGPDNAICRQQGTPKITELMISYSRDGFNWDRPDRESFIAASRKKGVWDRGYVQSVGGICTIVGDELRFYYSGVKGNEERLDRDYYKNGMHYGCSTGMAVLRRDGFVSMRTKGSGYLTTCPVTFKGKYLFVNVNCPKGELRVEILDRNNEVIPEFSRKKSVSVSVDRTLQQISWKGCEDLTSLIGKEVRFRFYLKNGELYSFWVSPDANGASYGYNAAGGPGFNSGKDHEGLLAYDVAMDYPKI